MSDSLRELLARCASGDEGAVEMLVDRFQFWALGFAAALLDDKSAAPDIVQEGFITALASLATLRDPDAFPGWFRQIIRRKVSRANTRRIECPLDENCEPVSCRLSPREQLDREKLRIVVRTAVESLPPASRVTAELFYFDEMKHSDIAEQLDIPIGTVKRRLHDARRMLRTILLGFVEEPRGAENPSPEIPFGHHHNRDKDWRF